jgi:hypothetical protein
MRALRVNLTALFLVFELEELAMSLSFTGLDAGKRKRLTDLNNGCLFGCEIKIDGSGEPKLVSTSASGAPSSAQTAFKRHPKKVIDNKKPTKIKVVDGDKSVPVNSFDGEVIDLKDIESVGNGSPGKKTNHILVYPDPRHCGAISQADRRASV